MFTTLYFFFRKYEESGTPPAAPDTGRSRAIYRSAT